MVNVTLLCSKICSSKSSKSSKNDLNTDLCADYWVHMILEVDFVEVQHVLDCPGVDHSEKAFLFLDTDLISWIPP